MKTKKRNFYRGDIVWADLGQHPGSHLLSGRHPCLIVRTDKSKGSVYMVILGSSKERKKLLPVHVPVLPENIQSAVTVKTIFMVEQMTTVDEQMTTVDEQMTTVDEQMIIVKTGHVDADSETMEVVEAALRRQLELDKKGEWNAG